MESVREVSKGGHVILVPYPAQGHINPMLQLGKRLVSYGARSTMAITKFIAKGRRTSSNLTSVGLEEISDGHDDGGYAEAKSIESYHDDFKIFGSKSLAEAIDRQKAKGFPVDCIIYDSLLTWSLDVAKQLGLLAVPLFTQPCTVNALYYQAYKGELRRSPFPGPINGVPHLLDLQDMPSFLVDSTGPYAAYLSMLLNQFSNLERADVVLFNTIYELEPEVTDWLANHIPAKTIGPTLPSTYLDNRVIGDSIYGFDLFTRENCQCKAWLDSKTTGSVVYVSFGSVAKLSHDQMEELAYGLKNSNRNFLWVVREMETTDLPRNFLEETKDVGLVVGWSPQLEVLVHPAIGCFVTHCGWNSTLEGLCLGVPMVAVPQWTDQPTNAKLMEDVWGVGVRAGADERGFVRREVVESCVREVMGERRDEIKKKASRWKELVAEAVSDGGSSDVNIRELIGIIRNNKNWMQRSLICYSKCIYVTYCMVDID